MLVGVPFEREPELRALLQDALPDAPVAPGTVDEAAAFDGLVILWDACSALADAEAIFARNHGARVLVLGPEDDPDRASRLMRMGVLDVRRFPCPAEALAAAYRQQAHLGALSRQARARKARAERDARAVFVTEDVAMQRLLDKAALIAPSRASVLLIGETGVGKERMARFVHASSDRAGRAFVALNCAAIPEGVLEAELFGHEKGAFTGAIAARPGKFELADGGTLLLDEITEMPLHLQAKLLRVLQEGEVDRLGGRRPVRVDVRVIATSNRDVERFVEEGRFREDLYFRLNVVTIEIPPLRRRPADIPALARHFLARFADTYGMPAPRLSEEALGALAAHGWPGNARELENCMHRAFLMAQQEGVIRAEHLEIRAPRRAAAGAGVLRPGMRIRDMERALIEETLEHVRGNRTEAARLLGISVRTLRNKLRQYAGTGPELAHETVQAEEVDDGLAG